MKTTKKSLDSLHFIVRGNEETIKVLLVDEKGKEVYPDCRSCTGALREVVREYSILRAKDTSRFSWSGEATGNGVTIDERLLLKLLSIGMLYDEGGNLLTLDSQTRAMTLSCEEIDGGRFHASIVVSDLDSKLPIEIFAPDLVKVGKLCYTIGDLGPFWNELSAFESDVESKNRSAFLSLVMSKFPSLRLEYNGYSVKKGPDLMASSALLFQEIDAYGYLHVKPLSYLEGFPPSFFDEQEIIKAVSVDDEEHQVTVSDVLFAPTTPADQLTALFPKGSKESVYEENGQFILEGNFGASFIASHFLDLAAQFILLQTDVLTKYKVKVAKPKVRMHLSSGIDYLAGTADVDIDGQSFTINQFLTQYRKQGYIVLSDSTKAYIDQRYIARFNRLVQGKGNEVTISPFDLPALSKETDSFEITGIDLDAARAFYTGLNTLDKTVKPTEGKAFTVQGGTLRPYQEYGVKWMKYLRDAKMGGCLADEMGLGKTVEVISMLSDLYKTDESRCTLILVPRTIIFNWQNEIKKFAPKLKTMLYYGIGRDVKALKKLKKTIILSSYATIRNDIEDLSGLEFCYVILDESQNIKNLENKTTTAVLNLRCSYRLALSGTPIENSISDLYSMFRFLNPPMLGSQGAFTDSYIKPIQQDGDQDAMRDLKTKIYPFILRRTKRDVLKDLPPKTEQISYIELDPDHLKYYNQRRCMLKQTIAAQVKTQGIAKSSFSILQALTELRRIACTPEVNGEFIGENSKRNYLKSIVKELTDDGHKLLIFTNFLASVDMISSDLDDEGIRHVVMTGSTSNRQLLINQFQSDPETKAFVMTLKTGGVGLNLTAADYVFIYDPWWNVAAEEQAIDRIHRIGQTNPVFCYRMIAKDTIEEKILELQQRKAALADQILSSDESVMKNLSEEDLETLLSGEDA